jgi:hypothetical protein
LLRLPLRTPAQAESSKIRTVAIAPEVVVDALPGFVANMGRAMLFLKSLRRVRVQRWDGGGEEGRTAAAALPMYQIKVAFPMGEGEQGGGEKDWGKGFGMGLSKLVNQITAGGRNKVKCTDVDLHTEIFG